MTPPDFAPEITREIQNLFSTYPDCHLRFRLSLWETSFLRFHRSQCSYIIDKSDFSLQGEIVQDGRKTAFELASPNPQSLRKAAADAVSTLSSLPPDPDFVSFEDDEKEYDYPDLPDSLREISPEEKTALLRELVDLAGSRGFDIFGIFVTLREQTRILASNGLEKAVWQAPVMLEVKAVHRDTEVTVIDGFAGDSLKLPDRENFLAGFARRLEYACLPVTDLDPGDYDAVLAPYAVQEFMTYLSFGMYAQSLDQASSFFENKLGRRVFPAEITLRSSPFHPRLVRTPYNYDGHLSSEIPLIEEGVFRNFVTDHYYSHKLNLPKNGSVGNEALVLEKGSASLEDMIRGVRRGLYISNLHYMNFINEKETSVTGLTRDGTFLIEEGRITHVVKNLRFTLRISSLLEGVTALEDRQSAVPVSSNYGTFSISAGLMPHIRTSGFRISSSTHTI